MTDKTVKAESLRLQSGGRESGLSIWKRDADCYDVTTRAGRVAALRSDFTEDERGTRTAIPGTWRVRWEHHDADGHYIEQPQDIQGLHFASVYEAFAFYCGQVLA